jgi:zinc/manganese transport system substrate-binding protein
MRLSRDRRSLAIPSTLVVLILAACQGSGSPSPSAPGFSPRASPAASGEVAPVDSGPVIEVLGTENFYADLLTQVGGSRVHATSLLNDPNADPHEFESSTRDAVAVADAKLVIVNGLGYDAFMQKLLGASSNPARVVIDVQTLLGLADDVNVHVWYDSTTMPKVAAAAGEALAKLDPPNAAYFRAREQAYLASLQPIADKIAQLKTKYAGTPIAFTENVAGHMTDRIGLVVKTPVGFMKAVEEGTDPPPADVAAEQGLLTGKTVKLLVYNSQVTSPTTQRIHDLAVQNGIPVVGVAETIPPAYNTYRDWQLAQLGELEQALGKAA